MPPQLTKKHLYAAAGSAVLFIGIGVGYHFFTRPPQLDTPILKAFEQISSVRSYTQHAETEVQFPDRSLAIIGTYQNDAEKERYASLSTTTLTIPGEAQDMREHVFTHENIAIRKDIYVRLQTTSKLLKKTGTVSYSDEWRHFDAAVIPEQFENIAVPGPIHDSLLLLSENGKYITLTKKHGTVTRDAEELLRYTFKLSGIPAEADSPLQALVDRIGLEGTIDVWIDEQTSVVKFVVLANAEYRSTTTISDINTSPAIEAPQK